MSLRGAFLFGAAMLVVASVSQAQAPRRPKMAADADTNDWNAYFDYGVQRLRREISVADDAFYWASRLDPTRPEPLVARWAMFWTKNRDRFAKYLNDDEKTLDASDVKAIDSLRMRALQKNPFVHQGLFMRIFADLPGGLNDDAITRAWVAYGEANLKLALDRFGRAINQQPRKYAYLRFVRASAFVNLRQLDSAYAEVSELLKFLRAQETTEFVPMYNSKELLEYALARIHAERGELALATDALGRALGENAAFAPAHDALGRLAQAGRDWDRALTEYGLAVELDPGDVESRLAYATALYYDRKGEEGVKQIKAAIELEPYYADSYLALAKLYDLLENPAGASEAYRTYIAMAPRSAAANVEKARARLKALGAPVQ